MRSVWIPLFIGFLVSPPSFATTLAVQQADDALVKAGTCSIGGLGPTLDLIKKYDADPDPDMRAVVARARYQEGFVYWFHQDYGYRSRFEKVIRLYDHDPDPRIAAFAGQARVTMAMTEKNEAKKLALILPILDRYKDTEDAGLAQIYVNALDSMSDIKSAHGDKAEADRLYAQGVRIFSAKVRPWLKTHDPSKDTICV